MNPQERQLVAELFDRLASLEPEPRDPDAERVIAEGFRRAPHGGYALVQTVLVQDEALKRANARIEELQAMGADEAPHQGSGFLDNMRDALLGRDDRRGSVPSVRPGGLGSSGVWGPGPAAGAGGPPMGGQPMGQSMGGAPMGAPPMGAPGVGGGGSFLGTAAASAAGVIGGAMMLNGIRSMFGHSPGGTGGASALASGGGSPWGGSAANSDLAREAGLDHIGGDKSGASDTGDRHAGLFGGDDQHGDTHDDPENDGSFDDDTDVAGDLDGGDSEEV
jgi:hypothetical protein